MEEIKELTVKKIGFIAINGFAEKEEPYLYLDGNNIFANEKVLYGKYDVE